MTPSNRVIIASSLAPISRMIGPAANKASIVSRMTRLIAPSTIAVSVTPSARAVSSMAVAIDPGPAIIGIAIGKTEISSAPSASTWVARSSRRAVRRSNTISSAMMNSMMPPASRKLASVMPSVWSNGRPSIAKKIRITHAISAERIAILRR